MPYSFTRVLSDFPLLALAPLNAPGFERYFLLKGKSKSVPTVAQIRPTGKNVKKLGEFKEYMMQYDTATTIAEVFGLECPQAWRGQSMSQVFVD